MFTKRAVPMAFVAALLTASVPQAVPLPQQVSTNDDWCRHDNWGNDREGVCEVREYKVAAGSGQLSVDAEPNGGIDVAGQPAVGHPDPGEGRRAGGDEAARAGDRGGRAGHGDIDQRVRAGAEQHGPA